MSPMTTHSSGRRRGAGPPRSTSAGPRLAARAAVVGPVVAHLPRVERPDRPVDPLVDGADVVRADEAARHAGLVGDDRRHECPLTRKRSTARRAPSRAGREPGRRCRGRRARACRLGRRAPPRREGGHGSALRCRHATGEAMRHGERGNHAARPRHRGNLSRGVLGPGAIRRNMKSAGECQPAGGAEGRARGCCASRSPAQPCRCRQGRRHVPGQPTSAGPRPRRQSLPCRRRIRASSMLPRCTRTLTERIGRPHGVHDVPLPHHELPARLANPQREVCVLAVGPWEAFVEAVDRRESAAARYAMSAVAHSACSRPAVERSQSVVRRPSGRGTRIRPCTPATRSPASARSRWSASAQPSGTTTSSSRKAIHAVRARRAPRLRAAAGPLPRPGTMRTESRPAASSGTSIGGARFRAVVHHDDLGCRQPLLTSQPDEQLGQRGSTHGGNDDGVFRRRPAEPIPDVTSGTPAP